MVIEKRKLNKVAGYRVMIGLNQTEVGNILGISKQAYSNKERGKNQFNDQEKVKLKELFQVYFPDISIDDLFF